MSRVNEGATLTRTGGWRVHTGDDTPSRNTATRAEHCSCVGQVHGITAMGQQPRAAAGSWRNGIRQAVAATTGSRPGAAFPLGRECRKQHRNGIFGSRTRPEEAISKKGKYHRAAQAGHTRAFKQQVFYVAPSVFPGCLSPRNRASMHEGKSWSWQRQHTEPAAVSRKSKR